MEVLSYANTKVDSLINQYSSIELLKGKASTDVYAIGAFMNKGIKSLVNQDSITIDKVFELATLWAECTMDDLHELYPLISDENLIAQQTNLVLVYAIMEALDINEIHFLDHTQSVEAVAVYEDIWSDELVQMTLYDAESLNIAYSY